MFMESGCCIAFMYIDIDALEMMFSLQKNCGLKQVSCMWYWIEMNASLCWSLKWFYELLCCYNSNEGLNVLMIWCEWWHANVLCEMDPAVCDDGSLPSWVAPTILAWSGLRGVYLGKALNSQGRRGTAGSHLARCEGFSLCGFRYRPNMCCIAWFWMMICIIVNIETGFGDFSTKGKLLFLIVTHQLLWSWLCCLCNPGDKKGKGKAKK